MKNAHFGALAFDIWQARFDNHTCQNGLFLGQLEIGKNFLTVLFRKASTEKTAAPLFDLIDRKSAVYCAVLT